MEATRVDKWIRQLAWTALLMAALALLVLGVALYLPIAHAQPASLDCARETSSETTQPVDIHENVHQAKPIRGPDGAGEVGP